IDPDAWKVFLQKLIGKREIRHYARKEVIMTPPDYPRDIEILKAWNERSESYLRERTKRPSYGTFWKSRWRDSSLTALTDDLENTIEDLLNASENLIIGKLMDFPVIRPLKLNVLEKPAVRLSCEILFPIGGLIYGLALWRQKQVNKDLVAARKVNEGLIEELRKLV
ncbi:MAG: hypothetical protein LBB85_11235, partial [Dysgonamonadaceae bacterium]|nr:hypothetical protein [Dysgonamonadaceae bacterium]